MRNALFALVTVSFIIPALQAADQPKPALDYKQTVKVDPNYPSSPEKKHRERRQKQVKVAAKRRAEARAQALAAQAFRQYVTPARTRSHRRVPYIPLLGTALLTGAGAVIGHQSHHAWEGAAAGAVVGGILDTWLYQQSRRTPE